MNEHSTNFVGTVYQSLFYKAPIPLLIGNLPFGDDFKNKRHEYEYLNYYIVPKINSSNEYGVLLYSKFLDNYIVLKEPLTTWAFIYPAFSINNEYYYLNPFVNDVNGACSWIPEVKITESNVFPEQQITEGSVYYSNQVYFNFEENRYELGLGENVWNLRGTYQHLHNKNLANGYTFGSDGKMNYELFSTFDAIRNKKPDTLSNSGIRIGYAWSLSGEGIDFENVNNRDDLDKNMTAQVINENISKSVNAQLKYALSPDGADYYNFYERIDLLPDLDHEADPEKFDKICGVYENVALSHQFVMGSIVIGNTEHKDDIGYFVGINSIVSQNTGISSGRSTNHERIQATNVIEIPRKRNTNPGYEDHSSSNAYDWLYNANLIITLGYTVNLDKRKYLVYYMTRDSSGLYKRYRLFIVDKDPSLLFQQKKIWYADLQITSDGVPDISKPPQLFRYPFYYNASGLYTFTELEFNYINLEDENDKKDPVKFTVIGACRENANQELLNIPISPANFETRDVKTYFKTNTFIGYWDTPIVNFEEQQ